MSIIPSNAYIIIIGAMRAGATTLYSLLSQHPQICPCKAKKEPMFFTENSKHESCVEEYSELWDFDKNSHRYVIEASTPYTKFPFEGNVPRRIKEYGLNPRFIYIVRDPFQRIESQYHFSIDKRWFIPDMPLTHERYVTMSRYFTQLYQYRKYFRKEQITIINFHEFVQDPSRTLETLCGILGIQSFTPHNAGLHYNKSEFPTRAHLEIGKTTRRLKQIPLLQSLIDTLPWQTKNYLLRQTENALEKVPGYSKRRKRRTLDHQERAIIRNKLENDMYRLKKEYAVPVEKWGFN